MKHTHLLILAVPLVLGLGSCAPKTYEDPVTMMTSREVGSDQRLAAARQADASRHDDPARIAALNHMLWDRGYSLEERKLAIDELVAYDEARFKAEAASRVNLLNWYAMDYLGQVAVKRHWIDFTPVLVHSLSRPTVGYTDLPRPEIAAILALNPGRTLEEIVFDIFANAGSNIAYDQQVGAWTLLCRTAPPPRLMEMLAKAPDRTPLVIDLKAAAADLKVLPRNPEDILRLSYLRDPARKEFWEAGKARVAKLTPAQLDGLQLRHIPVLLALDDATLALDKPALYQAASDILAPAEHHLRGDDNDDPQSLAEHRDKLCWADLATIVFIGGVLRDRGAAGAFFDQADADLADISTEYGGVLTYAGGRFIPRLFKPKIREYDTKFIAPLEMMDLLYTSIAHYHFHAQRYKNADFAGPGKGDLDMADHINANCIVLTFIDHDRLNIDYYQAGRVIVDLGTIHR